MLETIADKCNDILDWVNDIFLPIFFVVMFAFIAFMTVTITVVEVYKHVTT